MIEFTIKTLDSKNHKFTVEDETTIEQLKELIRERLGISVDNQRLIFFGRVLQDDKKLSDIDVQGKVMHLVQRPPPFIETQQLTPEQPAVNNAVSDATMAGMQQQIRRLMAITSPADRAGNRSRTNGTEGRIDFIDRQLTEVREVLAHLTAHVNHMPAPTQGGSRETGTNSAGHEPNTPRRSGRGEVVCQCNPINLGMFLREINTIQEQFAPHLDNYIRMLIDASTEISALTETEREYNQHFVNLVSDVLHILGHIYHAVSDITFLIGTRHSCLLSPAVPVNNAAPYQAHISVLQPNTSHHPAQPPSDNNQTNQQNTPGTSTATETRTNMETGSQGNEAAAPGQNNINVPIVRVTEQPDSISYQLGIEATFPVVAHVAPISNQSQSRNEQNRFSQATPSSAGQTNRPQTLVDIENILSGLNQSGSVGVGILMSMEEIPQGALGNNLIHQGTNQQGGRAVILSPVTSGTVTGTGQLQNLVTSMLQQGLARSLETAAVHARNQHQQQVRRGFSSQNTPRQGLQRQQNQMQQNFGRRLPAFVQAQRQPTRHPRRQRHNHGFRGTTQRPMVYPLNDSLYDIFLPCDNPQAHCNMQLRRYNREQNQQFLTEQLRARRIAAQNIEVLTEMNPRITRVHMNTIINLLNSPSSPESRMNAILVTIARYLFVSEPIMTMGGEPPLVPNEFAVLLRLIRGYIEELIRVSQSGGNVDHYQAVADHVVNSQAQFIEGIRSITGVLSAVSLIESFRALMRRRLPTVFENITLNGPCHLIAPRFYAAFYLLFMDLSGLILLFSLYGYNSLRHVSRAFVIHVTQRFPIPARQAFIALMSENIEAILSRINGHMNSVRQFVRFTNDLSYRLPDFSAYDHISTEDLARESTEESMQVSPESPIRVVTNMTNVVSAPAVSSQVTQKPAVTSSAATAGPSQKEIPKKPLEKANHSDSSINNKMSATTSMQTDVNNSNNDSVSSATVSEHWDYEQAAVITQDQMSQRDTVQEPFSDGYLSGLPPRRRTCVLNQRPPTTLDSLINESARESDAQPEELQRLRGPVTGHVRNVARDRANNSQDFDPNRYPSVARFIVSRTNESGEQEEPIEESNDIKKDEKTE